MNVDLCSIYYNVTCAKREHLHAAADVIKFDSVPLTRRS